MDLAYTLLNANVKESYIYTNGASSYKDLSGNRIPGVASQKIFFEFAWTEPRKLAEIGDCEPNF